MVRYLRPSLASILAGRWLDPGRPSSRHIIIFDFEAILSNKIVKVAPMALKRSNRPNSLATEHAHTYTLPKQFPPVVEL